MGVDGQAEISDRFHALHERDGQALLMPNPWDAGSARLLESLGFEALATTSSGFAATLARRDGGVTRDEALAHCAQLVAAVGVPVSADLENGFADEPSEVSSTVRLARETGLAGCSIEDSTREGDEPIYPFELAVERVAAAVEAAHAGPAPLVLTARSENFVRNRRDLADTIARLQAFEGVGADVLFAPGLTSLDDIRAVVAAVSRPVNVLLLPGAPTVAELAAAGVRRISVGGGFAFAAYGTLVEAARELREQGTAGYWERMTVGVQAVWGAFSAVQRRPA